MKLIVGGGALDGIGTAGRRTIRTGTTLGLGGLVALILTDHQAESLVEGHLSKFVWSWEGSGLSFGESRGREEGGCCEDVEKHDDYDVDEDLIWTSECVKKINARDQKA